MNSFAVTSIVGYPPIRAIAVNCLLVIDHSSSLFDILQYMNITCALAVATTIAMIIDLVWRQIKDN